MSEIYMVPMRFVKAMPSPPYDPLTLYCVKADLASTWTMYMTSLDGTSAQLLAGSGNGDVTAAGTFGTDNALLRSDGTGKGVQSSGITVDDSNNVSGAAINLASNTLSGTLSEFNTACSNGDFAFLGQNNIFTTIQDFQGTSAPAFIQLRRMDTASGIRSEGLIDYDGTNGSGNIIDALGRMEVQQLVITDGAESGRYVFATKQAGSLGSRGNIGAGIYHDSASGGDLGNNTINFGAVYDDNSLLSCYPFDQYLDGKVDLKKWDKRVPDKIIPAEYKVERRDTGKKGRDGKPILEKANVEVKPATTEKTRHEFARKFLSRIGTEYDPLTLDGYAKHWKDKRHLPAMPNEAKYDPVNGKLPTGAWVQRLVETAEVQAVLIERLNQITKDQEKRIAALEATVARLTA